MLGGPFGKFKKASKATVIHELKKGVAPVDTVPSDNTAVIDGVSVYMNVKCITA